MTALRQKLIDEIQLRGFSIHTQDSYVRSVAGLAQFYHRSPDQISDQEIKAYLLHLLRDRKLACSSLIVAVSGLRFLYGQVLHRPTTAIEQALPRMKKPVRRPRVYSVQELEQFFNCPKLNRKHRAIFMTTYAAGLRVSEVCQLRIADLLSDRHQIRVVEAKGKKDRYTVLSPRLLEELRGYWRLYSLLFSSATATLLEFGRNNLKACLGITAALHTWGQNLFGHYHLHCVVTGGGLSLDNQKWVALRPKWLFPVRALSIVFRAKFRDGLKQLFERGQLQFPTAEPRLADPVGFARWLRRLCRHKWVVYAKRPFAGPQAVLAYLCRYTHRVAITNSRLEALDLPNRTVTFCYKDYAHQSRIGSMTLSLEEFLRRFCLHILPPRFVKIRHYGLLSNRDRAGRIAQARALLGQVPSLSEEPPEPARSIPQVEPPPLVCPHCGHPSLVLIQVIDRPKTPPVWDTS